LYKLPLDEKETRVFQFGRRKSRVLRNQSMAATFLLERSRRLRKGHFQTQRWRQELRGHVIYLPNKLYISSFAKKLCLGHRIEIHEFLVFLAFLFLHNLHQRIRYEQTTFDSLPACFRHFRLYRILVFPNQLLICLSVKTH